MKITWFGSTVFRVHIGGQIVVLNADRAGQAVEKVELTSGADLLLSLRSALPKAEGRNWRPRARERLLDAAEAPRPLVPWSLGDGTALLDADDDQPLLVVAGALPELGRWAERAVVVLAGQDIAARALILIEAISPRLLALAGSDAEVGEAFAVLAPKLDGTGLIALEQRMAVEV
jgi:hypothetical protein